MAYNHKRTVRETIAYSGTSILEFAARAGVSAEAVDRGLVSLQRVHDITGVSFEKMDELGHN
jgi:hypothetical protein